MELFDGEPAGGPWRAVPVEEVLGRLLAGRATAAGRPWVVAVDGRGGSGKTTLATALAAAAGPVSAVLHTDDVAWHHSFFDWDDMLAEHVLTPARAGRPVRFTPPAWRERGRPGAVEVPAPCDLLIIEGCGAARQRLAPLLDATVWVRLGLTESRQRLYARDGDDPATRAFIADWEVDELARYGADRPWERATVVVDGSSPQGAVPPPGHVLVESGP